MARRNAYGFDFLKSEHTLTDNVPPLVDNNADTKTAATSSSSSSITTTTAVNFAAVALKPDLEKQFHVLHFLQAHRSAGYLAPSTIYKATGIDLVERDENVAKMLQRNPKIRIQRIPDPENPSISLNTYAYSAKYNHVRDRTTLLAQINRCKNGVPVMRDLADAYDGVEEDVAALITAGDVLAVPNPEDKDRILFPRGEAFLVELDGIITVHKKAVTNATTPTTDHEVVTAAAAPAMESSGPEDECELHLCDIDVDPTVQIRRGEAVCVGGQWFRVSSAVRDGVSLSEQPARAQAPLSVSSMTDMSKKNEADGYIRPFNDKVLPLDAPLSTGALENLAHAKQARERLHKLAGGRGLSGGVAAQLLSPLAHSSNPTTLASSFITTSGLTRKRPLPLKSGHSVAPDAAAQAVQAAAVDPSLHLHTHARRHGCTKDVRAMYLATRKLVPQNEQELHNVLLEHKLIEPGEAMRRPRLERRADVDNDGKPKKRRYYERKNQRLTNVHLLGTEIGAALARATEKQKQGKSVGDGGM